MISGIREFADFLRRINLELKDIESEKKEKAKEKELLKAKKMNDGICQILLDTY